MGERLYARRAYSAAMAVVSFVCALVAVTLLLLILGYVVVKGYRALNLDLLTKLPKPVGETGGGVFNSIVGTLEVTGIACLIGLPIGLFAGVFLSEYGRFRLSWWVRFAADVLTGIPSIIAGIVAYSLVVIPMHHFSALAGGVALALILIPLVARTAEESIRMVPHSLREAGLALGIAEWRTTVSVVVKTAATGIVTGILLAVARIAGESAPLLFTALNNHFLSVNPNAPISTLPVQIYNYSIAPYEDWQAKAWASGLLLVFVVLCINLIVRSLTSHRSKV